MTFDCQRTVYREFAARFAAAGCKTEADCNALASAILGRKVEAYGPNAIRLHEVPVLLAALEAGITEPKEHTP